MFNLATQFFFLFFIFLSFYLSRATPSAYGGSQAGGPIGAVATGLHHSHSNLGSEPRLQPTPQLTSTPDPQPTEQHQGSNPKPHGSQSDSLTTAPRRELLFLFFRVTPKASGCPQAGPGSSRILYKLLLNPSLHSNPSH